MHRPIPLWFCSALSDFARVHFRHFPDATPGRIRFRTPNTLRFLRSLFTDFTISLCLYSPCPLPTYQPLSAIRRIQDVILRREYVTRGRAKRQTSNQGAWRDGSLRADEGQKGGKIFLNLPPNLPVSTGFKWFPLCPSFIIERRDFLKEIREEMQILTT